MTAVQIVTSALTLVAGVGIFLVACTMMSSNLEALGSRRLKALFGKTQKSKLLGVGVGAAGTALLQSSSATTVMVIGFVNAGIMTLTQAATVIYGANIGTTITGQLVALGMIGGGNSVSSSVIFGTFAGIGAFVSAFAKKDRTQKIGGIFAGFGMLFVGLTAMSDTMSALAELQSVKSFLAMFRNPFLLVLIGALLTAVVQSSSVMTSLSITMVVTGLFTINQGIYVTIGANIGTCVTALIAGFTGPVNAKRTALIHLIFNVCGAAVFLLVGLFLRIGGVDYGYLFSKMFPNAPQLQLAFFHTVFNISTVAIVLPLTGVLVKLVTKLVPERKAAQGDEGGVGFKYVEDHMLKTPPIAVHQVKAEIIDMAETAEKNFGAACDMVCTLDLSGKAEFEINEKRLNFLNKELARFIAKLLKAELNERDRVYLSTAFRTIVDLERVGDYAENIVEYAERLTSAEEKFSDEAVKEITDLKYLIRELYTYAAAAYKNTDAEALKTAYALEERIDAATDAMTEHHIRRVESGACSADVGTQYLSFTVGAERVADHYINFAKTIKSL